MRIGWACNRVASGQKAELTAAEGKKAFAVQPGGARSPAAFEFGALMRREESERGIPFA
jgi:hypothetical protein